jgi:hypothetical protein
MCTLLIFGVPRINGWFDTGKVENTGKKMRIGRKELDWG